VRLRESKHQRRVAIRGEMRVAIWKGDKIHWRVIKWTNLTGVWCISGFGLDFSIHILCWPEDNIFTSRWIAEYAFKSNLFI
jgi:hypothetical protein